ncbi:SMI1/KNR4 family protein [Streptacidiphilus jiangxiensis]|uniref:SMI1 / KNR4 family (SUKH-1) n=1 Tax=Streptacidiphilus jiangxiensis TaxID=235985 RepID=A0A1H7V0W9_STRJI|nr:SMI1/KNR4 family protein [Streptacidiphilus jiangxiensis]SEM02842.1 SMI1 / KNR4 family (SUKH-1) [Streptacidiphilus jiangxiensis]
MHEAVEQLAQLLQGSRRNRAEDRAVDWAGVESTLGTALPGDYKEFVEHVGGGYLDGYLYLLEPDCPNENYDLAESTEERTEAFDYLWDSAEDRPAELGDPGARLIPFASTDNGEFLYWLARPEQDPDAWTVMVNEARGEWWERFDLGFAPLLLGLLRGGIRSEILTDDFPTTPHTFEPFDRPV